MNPKMTVAHASKVLNMTSQAVHKRAKSLSIRLPKDGNKMHIDFKSAQQIFAFDFKKQVIAMQIVKGGVGKTTLVSSIATCANLYGARVLCIDCDQQGNLTRSFNIDATESPILIDILDQGLDIHDAILPSGIEGLDILPSRMDNANLDTILMLKKLPLDKVYNKLINKVRDEYDLILIDCPPALGASVTAISLAVDSVIAPVTPEEYAIDGLKVSATELKKISETFDTEIDFKIILNKFDSRTTLSHEVLEHLITEPFYKEKIFKSYVRVNQSFANVIADRKTIYDATKPSADKEDIDLITRELLGINEN